MASSAKAAKIKNTFYKCAVYGIALFFIAVLQVTFFSRINILSASPDLLLGATVTLALKEDHRTSAVCGIIAGFFYCALGGFSYPIYILFSFLCGYILWSIAERALGKNYVSFLILSLIAYGLKCLYNLFEISLNANSFNIVDAFLYIILPEFISSVAFCSVAYLITSAFTLIFSKKSKPRKDGISK